MNAPQKYCNKCGRELVAGYTHFCTAGKSEIDPDGIDAHTPGAKLDAGKCRAGLVINGFARALTAVVDVGTYGADKYSDNGWAHVQNGQARYTDAMYRHLLAEASGERLDKETGLLHAAHAAWNAIARLDLMLRSEASRETIEGYLDECG